MGAFNGSDILVILTDYDNTPIAMQKGLTLSVDYNLPDGSSKDSGGWAEHLIGISNVKIDFTALFGVENYDDDEIISATDLMDYIINKTSLGVAISGFGQTIVGQVDMNSLSFDAPFDAAMGLTGSMKVNGLLDYAA
jgi:predicted secreted protein